MYEKLRISIVACLLLALPAATAVAKDGKFLDAPTQVVGADGTLSGGAETVRMGRVKVQIDPITGKGNVSFVRPIDSGRNGKVANRGIPIVNGFFDLDGVSCVDCGTTCTPGVSTREVVVSLEQNGGTAGVMFLDLDGITVGGGAGSLAASSLSCSPGLAGSECLMVPTGASAVADVTVNMDTCSTFSVFFDLVGSEQPVAPDGVCPCFDASTLAALSLTDPVGCGPDAPAPSGSFYSGFGTAPFPSVLPIGAVFISGDTSVGGCVEPDLTGAEVALPYIFDPTVSACICNLLYEQSARGLSCGVPYQTFTGSPGFLLNWLDACAAL